jgi:hypothetical protein
MPITRRTSSSLQPRASAGSIRLWQRSAVKQALPATAIPVSMPYHVPRPVAPSIGAVSAQQRLYPSDRSPPWLGQLLEGRFKAIVVEPEAYLVELVRSVVLNPVHAARVPEAGDRPWSRDRVTLGRETVPGWLDTDWVLGQFGETWCWAQAGYAAFVREGSDSRASGKGCAIKSFSAARGSWSSTALASSPRNGCARFPAPSAGRLPNLWRTVPIATPSAERLWRGLSKPASTPCRKSLTLSAYTLPP